MSNDKELKELTRPPNFPGPNMIRHFMGAPSRNPQYSKDQHPGAGHQVTMAQQVRAKSGPWWGFHGWQFFRHIPWMLSQINSGEFWGQVENLSFMLHSSGNSRTVFVMDWCHLDVPVPWEAGSVKVFGQMVCVKWHLNEFKDQGFHSGTLQCRKVIIHSNCQ